MEDSPDLAAIAARPENTSRNPFRRMRIWNNNRNAAKSAPPVPDVSSKGLIEPISPTAEKPNEVEILKSELGADLKRLADIQLRILNAKDKLGRPLNSDDPNENWESYKKRLESEANDVDKTELSRSLMERMEAAKGQLGDFCAVVGEGERKGVVLLSPLERTIKQGTYIKDPADRYKSDLAFQQTVDVQEVFVVNIGGLQKLTFPTGVAFDVPENGRYSHESWLKRNVTQAKAETEQFKYNVTDAWNSVLNDTPAKRTEQSKNIAASLENHITMGYSRDDDRVSAPYIEDTSAYFDPGIRMPQQVTVGLDVEDAFNDSVEQAKKVKDLSSEIVRPTRLYGGDNRK